MQIEHVAQIDSTNAELSRRVAAGQAGPGLVLTTDFQSAGRGRQGRTWIVAPGRALMFSTLIVPPVPAERWSLTTLVGACAVAAGIEDHTGLSTALKWPNDVLVDDQKVVGILAETAGAAGVILGVGINTGLTFDDIAGLGQAAGATAAGSLGLLTGTTIDRSALLSNITGELSQRLAAWAGGRDPIDEYQQRCVTLGQSVRVGLPGGSTYAGTAVGVDHAGRLQVAAAGDTGGAIRVLGAGDVTHVRPA